MCHPGTREAIVVRIADWYGYRTGPGKPIMWVHAPAGFGKTAIAGTVSKMLEEIAGLDFSPLGATFFFWRTSPERNSPVRLIITIAYQLAMSIPELAPHVENAIKRNPMILRKALEIQLVKLIVEPFKAIGELEGIPNRLVIIDGLDECINSERESRVEKKYAEDQEKVQVRVLGLVQTLQSHHLPLSFLILSRPEPWIEKCVRSWPSEDAVEVVDLFEIGDHMKDVEKYIRAELTRVSSTIEPQVGGEKWPTEDIVRSFVWKTNGHMLYASTAIQHIDDPYDDPRKRLEDILGSHSSTHPEAVLEHSTTFSSLYELYRQILRSCPASQRSVLVEVLEDISVATIDRHFNVNAGLRRALTTLDSVSGRAPGCGVRAIRGLHGVLHLSKSTNATNTALWLDPFIHSSFVEFLMNPTLSLEFAIDVGRGRRRLLRHCIECISAITSESKKEVEEDHIQYALLAFRPLWVKGWWSDDELRLHEAEYVKMVKMLLVVDLTTCFIKVFTRRETCLTPTHPSCRRLAFSYIAPKPIGPIDCKFGEDVLALVEQAFCHVQSSLKAALLSLLHQFRRNQKSGYWWSPEFPEGLEFYLLWLCEPKTNSIRWESDEIVNALRKLRHEQEKVFFEQLIRDFQHYPSSPWPQSMYSILDFIGADDT
jgi:hypothetical protein